MLLIYIYASIYLSNTNLSYNKRFKTYINVIGLYKVLIEIDNLILGEWSDLGFISDDSRGQLFSLDLLLALIPLTIMLGLIGANMDNILYLTETTVYQSSTERAAADTLNTLIETTGNPVDWQKNGNVITAGLADYDEPKDVPREGTISTLKLNALTWQDIQNLLGNNYGYFLNITSVDTNDKIDTFGTDNITSVNSSANNIVRLERTGLYAKFEVVSNAKDLRRYTGTPRVYTSPPNPFPTDKFYLELYDYYVIVVNKGYNSATVNINGQAVVDQNDFHGSNDRNKTIVRQINSNILYNNTELTDNTVDVRGTSNPGDTMDVYVVLVPKGTDSNDVNIDSAVPKKIRFQFYVWTK